MTRLPAAALLLLSFCAACLAHAGPDATRARLDAELADAIRQGDWPILDDGSTPRSRDPAAYPARTQAQLTRNAVEAEGLGALQSGTAPLLEDGTAPRDRAPQAFPAIAGAAPRRRAEVEAELATATARGEVPVLDDGRRPRDLAPSAFAGNDMPVTGMVTQTTARQASLPPC